MAADGYNPLRWDCDNRGCFNVKHRAKIEMFAECLPGRLAFTDVDATAEVNGHFLFLEFKSGGPRDIPLGQKIYFERLTFLSQKITAAIVCGNAETMVVEAVCVIKSGGVSEWQPVDLEGLKSKIKRWSDNAMAAPRPTRPDRSKDTGTR